MLRLNHECEECGHKFMRDVTTPQICEDCLQNSTARPKSARTLCEEQGMRPLSEEQQERSMLLVKLGLGRG